jgi:hypothetical protein
VPSWAIVEVSGEFGPSSVLEGTNNFNTGGSGNEATSEKDPGMVRQNRP